MAPEKSLSELAALLQKNIKILEEGTKGQPGSDFSLAFALPPPPAVELDASLEAAKAEALEAADELKTRLLGPFLYLGTLVLPVVRSPRRSPIPSPPSQVDSSANRKA